MSEEIKKDLDTEGVDKEIDEAGKEMPFNKKDGDDKKEPVDTPKKGDGEEDLDKDKISENFIALFDGIELSEEFKHKAGILFVSAVDEQAKIKVEKKEVELAEKLDTEISKLAEDADRYLTHAVRTYLDENQVAIASGMKVEAADKILESAKTILGEHAIDLPEAEQTALQIAESKVAELTSQLDESINKQITIQESCDVMSKKSIIDEASVDLAMTDKERLTNLSESIVFASATQFTADVETLRESFILGKQVEPVELDEGKKVKIDAEAVKNLDENVTEQSVKTVKRRF